MARHAIVNHRTKKGVAGYATSDEAVAALGQFTGSDPEVGMTDAQKADFEIIELMDPDADPNELRGWILAGEPEDYQNVS